MRFEGYTLALPHLSAGVVDFGLQFGCNDIIVYGRKHNAASSAGDDDFLTLMSHANVLRLVGPELCTCDNHDDVLIYSVLLAKLLNFCETAKQHGQKLT